MNVTVGHFQLTPVQRRFRNLLAAYPTLMQYWNFETSESCWEELNGAMPFFSRGEQIMATFFRCVLLGCDDHNFPMVRAAMVLGEEDMAVIAEWLSDPFFP